MHLNQGIIVGWSSPGSYRCELGGGPRSGSPGGFETPGEAPEGQPLAAGEAPFSKLRRNHFIALAWRFDAGIVAGNTGDKSIGVTWHLRSRTFGESATLIN